MIMMTYSFNKTKLHHTMPQECVIFLMNNYPTGGQVDEGQWNGHHDHQTSPQWTSSFGVSLKIKSLHKNHILWMIMIRCIREAGQETESLSLKPRLIHFRQLLFAVQENQ